MKFLALAALLLSLSTPALAIDMSRQAPSTNIEVAPKSCMTKESMFEWADKNKRTVYTLTPTGQKKLRDKVNMNRSRANKEPLTDAAEFFFISAIDPMNTGIAFFDKGCAVDEMTMLIDSNMLAIIFSQAGIKDEEIVKISEA